MNGKLVSQPKFNNAPSGFAYRLFGMFHASGSYMVVALESQSLKTCLLIVSLGELCSGCIFQIYGHTLFPNECAIKVNDI